VLDHPTAGDLEGFVRGALPAAQARALIAHLLAGCSRCALALASWAPLLREPAVEPPEKAQGVEDYGGALGRAFAAVGRHGARTLEHEAAVARALALMRRKGVGAVPAWRYSRLAIFEALIAYSWGLRHDDPRKMLLHLQVAACAVPLLAQDGQPADLVADCATRVQAELANALRINDRLLEAEMALGEACNQWPRGTRDPFLAARLHDVRASLLGAQYRYREAVEVLDDLSEIYRDLGDRHLAGRALINQGRLVGLGGDPARALALLEEGLGLIDAVREPGLEVLALHNRIYFLTASGCYHEAFTLLIAHRRRLLDGGGNLGRWKLLDIEAWILASLDHLDLAEALLREARAGSAAAGAAGHAALLTLNLSHVVLRQGRTAEARMLAEEAYVAFQELDISVEAQRAVAIVRDAFAAEIATAALLQGAVDFLRRLEHEPAARFYPNLG
jgi:hypothetical protein